MTFTPGIASLTARARAPEGAEGALSLEPLENDTGGKSKDPGLAWEALFPSGHRTRVRLSALGSDAFLFEIGEGPWPSTDALPAPVSSSSLGDLTFEIGSSAFAPGTHCLSGGGSGVVPAQFAFVLGGKVRLASVGDDYNVGNVPMRFPLFRHQGPHGVGYGIALGLTHQEILYGAGEDFGALAKNGRTFDFINADALGVNGDTRYQSTPTLSSSRGWSLTVLSREPCRIDAGCLRSDVLVVSSSAPRLRLLLQFLPDPRARASQLRALLSGSQGAAGPQGVRGVPAWSLGLWLSRCFYKDQAEVDGVLAAAKEHDFAAGVVNLDARCWMRPTTRTDFVWDTSRFSPFESYLPSLRERGYEICLWENPYVSSATETLHAEGAREGFFAKTQGGTPFPLTWVPEGLPGFPAPPIAGLVDFTNARARDWWKDKHRPFLRAGVKCFKTDFGEEVPSDARFSDGSSGWELRNAYADMYNDCVMEVLREEHGDDGIVWARSGWLHTFRYPVKWGGDSQTHWRALRGSLRAALSQAAGGALFWSFDIGGFYGEHPSPHFFLRAFQMGMYFTHARTHGITEREPWRFGASAERLCRTALKARLALMPYLEHVSRTCVMRAESGVMPLWMRHPEDPCARLVDDVFFLGDDLVVAPFLEDAPARIAYLPAGKWRDLRTGETHASIGTAAGRWVPLATAAHPHAPVFARVRSAFEACFEKVSTLLKGDHDVHLA